MYTDMEGVMHDAIADYTLDSFRFKGVEDPTIAAVIGAGGELST